MFERFTERARQVVVLAQEESRSLQHNHIGTEHILLGLLREEEGLAARVLESLGISGESARGDVVRIVRPGEGVTSGQIPFTPRAKRTLVAALEEALSLGHNYIGTEHLLLGLVGQSEGMAAQVLMHFDANAETVRDKTMQLVSAPEADQQRRPRTRTPRTPQTISWQWLDGLGAPLNQLAQDIYRQLGRQPDAGDLLLALACAPDTLAAQALQQLGIDLDALATAIEHQRQQALLAQEQEIEQVRIDKEQAIEAHQLDAAARLRDQERELTRRKQHQQRRLVQAREDAGLPPEVLHDIRRRLGILEPPPTATTR